MLRRMKKYLAKLKNLIDRGEPSLGNQISLSLSFSIERERERTGRSFRIKTLDEFSHQFPRSKAIARARPNGKSITFCIDLENGGISHFPSPASIVEQRSPERISELINSSYGERATKRTRRGILSSSLPLAQSQERSQTRGLERVKR